ncbi:MAG: hypothetical protein V4642_14120 [Bacteroidota bacterium]
MCPFDVWIPACAGMTIFSFFVIARSLQRSNRYNFSSRYSDVEIAASEDLLAMTAFKR